MPKAIAIKKLQRRLGSVDILLAVKLASLADRNGASERA
jgi:hypothetical protein